MAAQPPRFPWESGDGEGGPHGRPRRAAGAAWRWHCVRAWARLRALPGWLQLLLWLAVWPVVAALGAAASRRLGPLAAPLTVALLLAAGLGWWSVLEDRLNPGSGVADATPREAVAAAGTLGSAAFADVAVNTSELPEFDPRTLDIEIVDCVQTRTRSAVRKDTIRQPRIVVRVTNHGPPRVILLQGAVMLEDHSWNGGWKPTAEVDVELARGQSVEAALLTDYRHQSSYSPDGLHACRLIDLAVVAPQVWPEHPARQALPVDALTVAGSERDFDPQRDLLRPDAR